MIAVAAALAVMLIASVIAAAESPATSSKGIQQGAFVDRGGAASLDGHRFIHRQQYRNGTWGPWEEWDLRGRRTFVFQDRVFFTGIGVGVRPRQPGDRPSSSQGPLNVALSAQEVVRLKLSQ